MGLSSTFRELFAVPSSLRAFSKHVAFQQCIRNYDNQCAVKILKEGSLKAYLQQLARQFWENVEPEYWSVSDNILKSSEVRGELALWICLLDLLQQKVRFSFLNLLAKQLATSTLPPMKIGVVVLRICYEFLPTSDP
ncbi:hypothetical protein GCK32_002262 [Trichostrongylus colubriformis]|uniref:Uncharacterized protein n=1 Tax=Trichostrongylus colubriformis TaxID=6319 RepID=A0AAN8F742_TRICO